MLRPFGVHGPKSLTGFKLYTTSANIVVVPCKRTQKVITLLGPTLLGVVGQQCWVRLHGPLHIERISVQLVYLLHMISIIHIALDLFTEM